MNRLTGYVGAALMTTLMAFPSGARAQGVANSFEELPNVVQIGQQVTVTDAMGVRVSGALDSLSPASVGIVTETGRREFNSSDVRTIRRRSDRLRDGALWGLGAGAAIGYLGVQAATCSGCHWDPPSFPAQMSLLFGAMGAGVGVAFDAAFKHDSLLYGKPASSVRVSMAPQFGKSGTGIRLKLTF
jgi:hypothetical protein